MRNAGGLRVRNRAVHFRRRARRARAAAWLSAAMTGAAAAIAVAPRASLAASFTWDGGGNTDDWSTNNNWNPNGAPATGTPTDTITFAGTVRLTPNLNANRTIASLTFLSNAGGSAFTLNSSTGNTLTIGS